MNRPPYMPESASLIAHLPDMGSALHDSCIDLVREQTVGAVDALLSRLKAAEHSLVHLRKALVADGDPAHVRD